MQAGAGQAEATQEGSNQILGKTQSACFKEPPGCDRKTWQQDNRDRRGQPQGSAGSHARNVAAEGAGLTP